MNTKAPFPLLLVLRWSLCILGVTSLTISFVMLTALQDLLITRTGVDVVDVHRSTAIIEDWPHPFVHIVNTRFMQHQADLVALGRARLVLFETFCLQTMLGQSVLQQQKGYYETPSVLWIIKIDPSLDESLRTKLIELVEPYSFIYLVASNVNYGIGIHPGGWRGGQAGKDVLSSHLYTGNVTLIEQAHNSRNTRVILETRLDADDGLNGRYLETIQLDALSRLRFGTPGNITAGNNNTKLDWMYWCGQSHLDWTPTPPESHNLTDHTNGAFVALRSSQNCITAGLTLGVSVGMEETSIPRFMHGDLFYELELVKQRATCVGDFKSKTSCLTMLTNPVFSAIRSRTPTSAGMRRVVTERVEFATIMGKYGVPLTDKNLVEYLQKGFHITVDQIEKVNSYMHNHIVEIALDNLQGQCTHGHSCKNETRLALEEVLRAATNHTSTNTIDRT